VSIEHTAWTLAKTLTHWHAPDTRVTKAERYQLGFDFSRRPSTVQYDFTPLAWPDADGQEGTSRFTRVVREEITVHHPQEVAEYLLKNVYTPFDSFDQEEFWSLLLNTQNKITHEVMVYRGTIDSVHLRLAEVFKEAVRFNARGVILSHVHPSGLPDPSPEDVRFTEEALEAGKLLGIHLIDHLIIGRERWVSLKERQLGFGK
jgi:DNA repair protein RadC